MEVKNMTTIRKNITITDNQEAWLKAQIAAGKFTNESEIVRDLIRKAQAQDEEIEAIRQALIEGEESGISDATLESIRERVLTRNAGKHGVPKNL